MLGKSGRWFAGFALFFVSEVVVLFFWLINTGVSHPSLEGQIAGIVFGLVLGGLVLVSGIALMWGMVRYASYAFLLAGIEYSAIELYDGYAGGTPAFLALGVVFLAVGAILAYRAQSRGFDSSDTNSADTLTTIGVVTLVLWTVATGQIFRSNNPVISLSVALLGGIVAVGGRVVDRRQSADDSTQ